MRVKIEYTVDVDSDARQQMAAYFGGDGLASREDVKRWYEKFGRSMDDDLNAGEVA